MKKTKKKIKRSSQKRNSTNSCDKLCLFSSADYIVLASTLAIALGEELSNNDINILAGFFAVLSDELALISAVEGCNSDGDDSVFVAPTPDVAVTRSDYKSKKKK